MSGSSTGMLAYMMPGAALASAVVATSMYCSSTAPSPPHSPIRCEVGVYTRLLLVSTGVSARPGTYVLRYDVDDTLDQWSTRIQEMGMPYGSLDNIGWVAHSIENIFGTNVNQTNILSGLDPEGMDTLVTIMRLLHRYLRPSMHRIDLLACSLAAYPQFQLFAQTIRLQSGVDLAASTNTTGTSNWILETHQIDVKDVYFTERINVYDSSLFGRFGRGALFRSAGPLVAQDTMSRIERNKGKPIGTGFETLGNDIKKNARSAEQLPRKYSI